MFPSGSSPNTHVIDKETGLLSNWLSSSTYTDRPSPASTFKALPVREKVDEVRTKSHHKREQTSGKSSQKVFTPEKNTVFLDDTPGLKLEDAFYVDRSPNREIYKHGCIYEKQVAIFKQKQQTKILGFRNLRICDLADFEHSAVKKGVKKSRYFSKASRSIVSQPALLVSTKAVPPTNESFVPIIFLSDCPTGFLPPTNDPLTMCERLNRTVYDKPNDVKSWLDLLELHGRDASLLHVSNTISLSESATRPSDRLLVLRKQLAIAERALTANPGCLNLKVLTIRIEEMATELESKGAATKAGEISSHDRIDRDWAQLVFTYPQCVSIWKGYLGYLMGKYGCSNATATQTIGGGLFTRIDTIYKRGLSKLSGIISGRILSHRPMAQTAEQTIDLLADYCQWLVQAGHAEKAFAIWQAVIEFNCFRPADMDCRPYDQCILEMELFWTSGAARFGQPGSEHWSGWYRSRGKSVSHPTRPMKKSKKTSSMIHALEEVASDASHEESSSKWTRVTEQLKSIATSCEDALIHCSTDSITDDPVQKLGAEVVPSVLSAAATDDQWVRRGAVPSLTGYASIGKSRSVLYRRGKAWVGLERAREAVGWLPADVLTSVGQSDMEDEDPERLILFDDVKHCLLDLHALDTRSFGPDLDMAARKTVLQQRLLLHCFAFLGAFDPETAAAYDLPADVRLVYDLATLGSIQRQSLSPLVFQTLTMPEGVKESATRAKQSQVPGSHVDVWAQARRCVLDSALIQASHISRWEKPTLTRWTIVLSRIRYRVALERLIDAIRVYHLDGKTVLNSWRHFGRTIMSQMHNQQDLGLWQLYATGYWLTGLILSTVSADPKEPELLITESRRIFNTALQSHPIPTEFPEPVNLTAANNEELITRLLQFYGQQLAPRFQLIQHYVDLELGAFAGAGGLKRHLGCEAFALQLLMQVPVGGPFVSPESQTDAIRPSTLVRTGHAYGKRLEVIWRVVTSLTQNSVAQSGSSAYLTSVALLDSLSHVVSTLCYLHLLFDLLTSDEECLSTSLPGMIAIIVRVDQIRGSLQTAPSNETRNTSTRWSALESSVLSDVAVSNRTCSRHFIHLAMGGLAAFAALRQRHRRPILDRLFRAWIQYAGDSQLEVGQLPRELVFPSQLAYHLPARIALERRLLPFSIPNAASLRGLLSPLFLARLSRQLIDFSHQVGKLAATTLMDQMTTGSRLTSPNQFNPRLLNVHDLGVCIDSSTLLRGTQLELYTSCLPVAVELLLLSVELERWSGLIAGTSMNEFPGSPALDNASVCAQRVRNAFERAIRASPFVTPWLDMHCQPIHIALLCATPSFWTAHLRLVIWRAYMAFGWMCGSGLTQQVKSSSGSGDPDPRQRRQAVKAVFYRAIEDLPWAKVLYTDLVRYCPEDVEEVVDLLAERELRLRTPLEEVDLLLTARPVTE